MKRLLKFSLFVILAIFATFTILFPAAYMWRPAQITTAARVVRTQPGQPPPTPVPPSDNCSTPNVPHEPPCNPALARSNWSITHSSSYAQGSTAAPGPAASSTSFLTEHINLANAAITHNFTPPYADGGVAVWAALLNLDGSIVKIDHETFSVIDSYNPTAEENDAGRSSISISGAYTALDKHNRFIVGRQHAIEIYADSIPGDRYSEITLLNRLSLPESFFCNEDDQLVGLNLTYDNHLVVVSEHGNVAIVPLTTKEMSAENISHFSLTGADDDCVPIVSNSLAIDEEGGLYIVTSKEMVRLQWDGQNLSLAWRANYESGSDEQISVRLGTGSGSTPSLMGTGADNDKFVVFTDGQELMHLVLMWRDEIPADWDPIAPGKDRRIACEFPIQFGDSAATRSLSEQSVLVRGYASVVVNNLVAQETPFLSRVRPGAAGALATLNSGLPDRAAYGIERIDWDPSSRSCIPNWVNTELSIPNGIPTMSQSSGLFYGIGQRDGVWGLEAVDFESGDSVFFVESGQTRCSLAAFDEMNARALRIGFLPVLAQNPRICENSVYAATEVGPDNTIYTGTLFGATKFTPLETEVE